MINNRTGAWKTDINLLNWTYKRVLPLEMIMVIKKILNVYAKVMPISVMQTTINMGADAPLAWANFCWRRIPQKPERTLEVGLRSTGTQPTYNYLRGGRGDWWPQASITPQVQLRSTGIQPIYNDLKGGRGEWWPQCQYDSPSTVFPSMDTHLVINLAHYLTFGEQAINGVSLWYEPYQQLI